MKYDQRPIRRPVKQCSQRIDPLAVSHALSYVDLLRRVAETPERDGVMATAIGQDLGNCASPACRVVRQCYWWSRHGN